MFIVNIMIYVDIKNSFELHKSVILNKIIVLSLYVKLIIMQNIIK